MAHALGIGRRALVRAPFPSAGMERDTAPLDPGDSLQDRLLVREHGVPITLKTKISFEIS